MHIVCMILTCIGRMVTQTEQQHYDNLLLLPVTVCFKIPITCEASCMMCILGSQSFVLLSNQHNQPSKLENMSHKSFLLPPQLYYTAVCQLFNLHIIILSWMTMYCEAQAGSSMVLVEGSRFCAEPSLFLL